MADLFGNTRVYVVGKSHSLESICLPDQNPTSYNWKANTGSRNSNITVSSLKRYKFAKYTHNKNRGRGFYETSGKGKRRGKFKIHIKLSNKMYIFRWLYEKYYNEHMHMFVIF